MLLLDGDGPQVLPGLLGHVRGALLALHELLLARTLLQAGGQVSAGWEKTFHSIHPTTNFRFRAERGKTNKSAHPKLVYGFVPPPPPPSRSFPEDLSQGLKMIFLAPNPSFFLTLLVPLLSETAM